jgi:polyphosphate kinase 2 (PPK2 family)
MDNQEIGDLHRRLERELLDSYDEELELELDDRRFEEIGSGTAHPPTDEEKAQRQRYFKELLRLQGELVKLQDWVATTKHRVVILFEGRDAAGKGGVIKRITQRLNPRVCRVVALPAPNDRERTQWYFQRYVRTSPPRARWCCSTAAGTTGRASNGSWASARMRITKSSSARCPSSSACWCVRASS